MQDTKPFSVERPSSICCCSFMTHTSLIHLSEHCLWRPCISRSGISLAISNLGIPEASLCHKVSIETKQCASSTLMQKTFKNEFKHGPKNGTTSRSDFWNHMHSLVVKEQKKCIFTVSFLGPSGGTLNETPKSQNQQQRPTRATNKNYNCVYLSKSNRFGTENPAHAKPDFIDFPAPKTEPESAHVVSAVSVHWLQCGDCDAARPRQHSPILRYSALLHYSVLCFNSITQCNWHDIEMMAE